MRASAKTLEEGKSKKAGLEKFRGKSFINEKTAPYFFLSPVILIFALFMVYPIIKSLILCTQSFVGGEYVFVGASNFIKLFKDPIFWKSLSNTFIYLVIQVPIMVFLSLLLAVLLDSKFLRGKGFFRMSLFLPAITALVAYAMIFKLMLNTDYGMINHFIGLFGFDKIDWLNTTWGARISIILGITWRWTGYNMIIMIAGLQGIPTELYESAEIDGANHIQKFFRITIPMVKPIILFVAMTSTIGTLQLFDESYILTSGGPDNATITIGHYLYNNGFQFFKFGYASAISYTLVVIIALLSYLQFKLSKGGEI
jgi:lactose/L-arabinose transport system permease protein